MEIRRKESAIRLTHKSQDRSQLAANQRIADKGNARRSLGRREKVGSRQ